MYVCNGPSAPPRGSRTHAIAANFWRLVRPGGYYVIEDVNVGGDERGKYSSTATRDRPGFSSVAHNASGALREIYLHNEVFFADTMVGNDFRHNDFVKQQIRRRWMKDPVNHNGHLVVIRKRPTSR